MAESIFWIVGPWPGRLAIVLRPRGGDWLPRETQAWRRAGLDLVVSLLEPIEEDELDLSNERVSAAESGLDFRAFPIADRGVPSRRAAAQFAAHLSAELRAGRNVGLHCRQSVGRSALIAAAVLVSGGVDAGEALSSISAVRGVQVPETAEQRQWILGFKSDIRDLDPDV